jgi:hypothetical protein
MKRSMSPGKSADNAFIEVLMAASKSIVQARIGS